MTKKLTPSQTAFLQEIVRGLPMGMAVIHLANPKDISTWKLVASNEIASELGGVSVADFLALAILDRHQKHEPSIHGALMRQVLEKKLTQKLGRMRSKRAPEGVAVWEVHACLLANNCIGILFEEVERQKKILRELAAVESQLEQMRESITEQKRTEDSARLLSVRVIKAQEEDRKRISRELHDSIGQYLTSLKLAISEVSGDEHCSDAMREKLNECGRLVRSCMEEIRSVSNLLHPPLLDILGLIPALRWYARYFSERSAISLELDIPQEMGRLDQDTELALFRIFQECLTNIQRHARTSHAKVKLSADEQTIVLEVEDFGIGMPPDIFQQLEVRGGAIGLFKMRERIAELSGELEFHSSGKGTLVRARIPKLKARAVSPAQPEETRRTAPKRTRSK